jgi:ATP-dependent Lon protease
MRMRQIIKLQQGMIDVEYRGKDVPFLAVKEF